MPFASSSSTFCTSNLQRRVFSFHVLEMLLNRRVCLEITYLKTRIPSLQHTPLLDLRDKGFYFQATKGLPLYGVLVPQKDQGKTPSVKTHNHETVKTQLRKTGVLVHHLIKVSPSFSPYTACSPCTRVGKVLGSSRQIGSHRQVPGRSPWHDDLWAS